MKTIKVKQSELAQIEKISPRLAKAIREAGAPGVNTAAERRLKLDVVLVDDAPVVVVPDVPPAPVPAVTWEQRLAKPMLFFSGPNYFWHDIPAGEVPKILDAILAAGLTGPSIEFGGDFIADEYNGQKPTGLNVMEVYAARIAKWAVWEQGLRARGLVAHIAFLNSNQSAANKATDAQWTNMAARFTAEHGTRNKIVLALSEDDDRTRSSIRGAITKGLQFPAAQLITHDGKGGTIREEHHSRQRIVTGKGHRFLNVTDNRDAIADLYGSKWTSGGTPNLANIQDFAARIRAGGVSGAVYSFSTTFDFAGLAAASKGWKAAGGEVPGVGMLRSVKADSREFYIRWDCDAAVDQWPAQENLNGWIVVNGVKCEQFRPGYRAQHLKNAYGKDSHGVPGIKKGDTVRIKLVAKHAKDETNEVAFVWPWKST